jgi:type II secretory pathway component PulF
MRLYHAKYAQILPGGTTTIGEEDFYLPNVNAVRRQLRTKGLWPIHIQEIKPALFELFDVRSRAWQTHLLRSLRFQTATASAGTALLNIIEGETDPKKRLAYLPTRTVLKGGGSFAEALRELKLLDAATMAIIAAGEKAGDLKGVILHAIEHVEEKGKQFKVIIAALGWLSIDIFSILTSIWGAQYGFIPYLKEQGIKSTDPEAIAKFQTAVNQASWINGTLLWTTMTISIGLIWLGLSFWFNRHKTDHISQRILMKTPVISTYLRNSSLNDTCKLMSRLLRGKVPLADAIKILIESTIEPSTRLYWQDCLGRIMAGVEPGRALGRWPLTKSERDQISTVQSVDQLHEIYDAISSERHMMAKSDQRRIIQIGMVLMMVLFGAVVMTMIYLLTLQNQGFLEGLNQLKDG